MSFFFDIKKNVNKLSCKTLDLEFIAFKKKFQKLFFIFYKSKTKKEEESFAVEVYFLNYCNTKWIEDKQIINKEILNQNYIMFYLFFYYKRHKHY